MSNNALILALETSSRVGSVALALGSELLAQTTFTAPMRHSCEAFPAIKALLNRFDRSPAQINHVYISIGPGSFTGLRIATTVAKVMHLTNPVRIVAVDTLDVIAANAPTTPSAGRIAAILDAKRNQFYTAAYQRKGRQDTTSLKPTPQDCHAPYTTWQRLIPDSLMSASEFLSRFADSANPIYLLGDGLLYHKDKFQSPGSRFLDQRYWSPQAANVHAIGYQLALNGEFADPAKLIPTYIRRPEAEEKWRQR
ncbi:MAG: tRNA (adenosine(37)-N6)-threonylcarbamoyltransferase complex dimerization subunit type 1 TsaB [Sedimentisphaerales bacterium]|nr:tRNA (adenosine(37)-N6)-threonylcarbamoyltransferase complex dimerization subunit type 1 TsaB [Sedimentisphaerales bacterium]